MILDLSNKSTMQEDVYDLLKKISLTKKDQFNSIIDNYSKINRKKSRLVGSKTGQSKYASVFSVLSVLLFAFG